MSLGNGLPCGDAGLALYVPDTPESIPRADYDAHVDWSMSLDTIEERGLEEWCQMESSRPEDDGEEASLLHTPNAHAAAMDMVFPETQRRLSPHFDEAMDAEELGELDDKRERHGRTLDLSNPSVVLGQLADVWVESAELAGNDLKNYMWKRGSQAEEQNNEESLTSDACPLSANIDFRHPTAFNSNLAHRWARILQSAAFQNGDDSSPDPPSLASQAPLSPSQDKPAAAKGKKRKRDVSALLLPESRCKTVRAL